MLEANTKVLQDPLRARIAPGNPTAKPEVLHASAMQATVGRMAQIAWGVLQVHSRTLQGPPRAPCAHGVQEVKREARFAHATVATRGSTASRVRSALQVLTRMSWALLLAFHAL